MDKISKIDWIIERHTSTNHMYDNYIPYRFHLQMVVEAFKKFHHLLPTKDLDDTELACWAHDTIEDTRVSYNQVKEVLGERVADIVYALTNEKGKNRKERANSKYYEGIVNTPGATFVKLCDRIANVQYSIVTGSRMFEMYKKENENFLLSLGFRYGEGHHLAEMATYLEQELFKIK
jgi:(p)ppGpp synthase/HD superfamily hydrolase